MHEIELLKIKKIDPDLPNLKQAHKHEWIDLYSAEDLYMVKGDYRQIRLGVAIKLPYHCEAIIAPRSSTYKQFGLIMATGIGVVDNLYCGDDDEWMFPAIAMRNTHIEKGDRICQFRIQEQMPSLALNYVTKLGNPNRGGIGSTGRR